ncbi:MULTISPECIES: ABC transporter ATP-binding protein [Niallia]|uniref:ABC transporter ATP-binding protein n=2 Tax=Bacillaceae TaxID=186817 RepID=A0A941GH32_NIACI|nr:MULTISPECIES: ABC transporter ATP-binding protein [Niallia]EOR20764.1 ABC transporter ATP-binding protein [Niallia nealsonii AAU1]MDU1848533.1 ABC transporter ATP-binding protein [Niallia nealsonii]MCB5240029.1 ABC transporter ATP-binding protein [Niallia circulans]MED3795624.1 ABC transporter ATP-binding protein [Niallia alba]UTI43798.1 ABC transporter ATP-binding protein [Niallia sp. RD1]
MFVQVNQLQKVFKGHTAIKGITFNIKEGSCTALLGPNGAGKTTTLHMLSGLLSPTKGTITYSEERDYRSHIGFMPQHPTFFNWMTPIEFLQFAGKLSAVPKHLLKEQVNNTLSFVGLTEAKNRKIGGFSGGMKQRLGLAQAILHQPELLILDEPVSALDPTGRREVLTLMEKLKERMTILFSTHVLHDAEQVCDEVLMLKDGEIKWDGSLTSLKRTFSHTAIHIETVEPIKNAFDNLIKPHTIHFTTENNATILEITPSLHTNDLLTTLISKGYTIQRFEVTEDSLEDVYMKVVEI